MALFNFYYRRWERATVFNAYNPETPITLTSIIMEGIIKVRKTRNGKFYVRMEHENSHILWHGSGKLTLQEAVTDAWAALEAALIQDEHGRHTYLEVWSNINGDPYFRIKRQEGSGLYGWSESYSDRASCNQGKDAAIRIFEDYRRTQTPITYE